jgi:hypothetical protein
LTVGPDFSYPYPWADHHQGFLPVCYTPRRAERCSLLGALGPRASAIPPAALPRERGLGERAQLLVAHVQPLPQGEEHDHDYANRLHQTDPPEVETDRPGTEGQAVEATPKRTLCKRRRDLIYRIFEVDPLNCSRCGARMKILAFIIDPPVFVEIVSRSPEYAALKE